MTTSETSAPSAVAPAGVPLEVKGTVLEDRPTEEELKARAVYTQCAFETDFPPNLLRGGIYVLVSEVDKPGQPARIIDSNEPWLVDVYWFLFGQMAQLLCGKWKVKIFMESLGKDPLDLEIGPFTVPMNPIGFYHLRVYIPGGYVRVEPIDGTPFEINVATALLTTNDKASPIIGFCSLETILFFLEEIEVSP